jgi:hypothetical protein
MRASRCSCNHQAAQHGPSVGTKYSWKSKLNFLNRPTQLMFPELLAINFVHGFQLTSGPYQAHRCNDFDYKLHNLQQKVMRAKHDSPLPLFTDILQHGIIPLPRQRQRRKCEWDCATTASNNEARSSDKRCLQRVSQEQRSVCN